MWTIVGRIDDNGNAVDYLPAPPSEIVVAAEEQHPYDVTVIVEGVDPKDTSTISRQYKTKAANAEAAGKEVWAGVSNEVKARMAPVNDQG